MTHPATAKLTDVPTGATLGRATTIRNALWWRNVDFYPLVAEGGAISTLATVPMIQEMEEATARWPTLDDNGLETAINLAKQSLAEVKGQTSTRTRRRHDSLPARPF